ncbi:MAG TPA: ChaN family lipoprotein [Nannocystis sp.]
MRRVTWSSFSLVLFGLAGCNPEGGGEGSDSSTESTEATTTETSEGGSSEATPTTGATTEAATTEAETTSTGTTTGDSGGQSFPDPEEAPRYDGEFFAGMQIYDVAGDVWLDEAALMAGLDPARLVFVGEQHETAAIHELQRWVLERMLARHGAVALGMEQFQRDEQAVIDAYLAGSIDAATFEAQAQPWKNYAQFWKPLVELMKAEGRPVLALNVPDEALSGIYAAFPTSPLEVVNGWSDAAPYAGDVAPRPIGPWDAVYQGYFERSYDYASHGKDWGLSYEAALAYFTDLALIRDDTMGFWLAEHLEATQDRIVVVAGDWHVQTGLATPDSVRKFVDVERRLITTATPGTLASVKAAGYGERAVADYILVYSPK